MFEAISTKSTTVEIVILTKVQTITDGGKIQFEVELKWVPTSPLEVKRLGQLGSNFSWRLVRGIYLTCLAFLEFSPLTQDLICNYWTFLTGHITPKIAD